MTGYIKVYRESLQTSLLKNPVMLTIWIFLCRQVWFRETVQDGIEIQPGQVLISAGEIARACDLPERQVRYMLDRLVNEGLIRRENIRNRYSLITVLEPDGNKKTQLATPRPVPAEKRSAPAEKPAAMRRSVLAESPAVVQPETPAQPANKSSYGMFRNVFLTAEEKSTLKQRSPIAESYIDNLSAYKKRMKKDYEDDFAVLCEWICKDDINEKRNAAKQEADRLRREKEQTAKNESTPHSHMDDWYTSGKASYDLELAERIARESVPKLRKRRKP